MNKLYITSFVLSFMLIYESLGRRFLSKEGSLCDEKRKDRNRLQTKNARNKVLKKEIVKRIGFKEKNRINVGFRTPYAGFTPLTS